MLVVTLHGHSQSDTASYTKH